MALTKRTIKIKSYLNIHLELTAAAAITPGMLIMRTSANKVQAHNVSAGPAQKMFALEDAYQGRTISQAYDATTNKHVICWLPTPGDRVNAILDDASGTTVAIGDFVESAGDGRVKKSTVSSAGVLENAASIIGVAVEAQTTAGGRVLIEII
jgi:hypothetical protein